ncbi:peptide chain release factor N(5)-glutamine methyltransferase [Aminipila terrae]|uniref:Release factor glutamine methyltransferase n=1 Tax=Aminipila terrae TaxID=2697030 RepID=A0A6P1MM11_9FIRM|nr:peptide chain release factor N(5)-glutamine methyltransferase [Aminipila terrae]QHI72035.1 peptide chain release factor N(5)-glutamine methyltransferase [Aminipila terrae]
MAMIVKEMLQMGQRTLEGAGIYDAKVDAERLLCHMLNLDRGELFMIWSKTMEDSQCNRYFDLIDTRATRIPLQHITGVQQFMGYDFKVDKNVLIPRLDTELLTEAVMDYAGCFKGKITVLDLCCGSGAIGISLAKLCKNMKVVCSDISEEAIRLTKENARTLKANVTIKKGDLFEPFKGRLGNTKFDIIVSNPPYIESEIISTLDEEVRTHEPHLALDGGEDGMDFYRQILKEAPKHLGKGGMLFLEVGHNQGNIIADKLAHMGQYTDIEIRKDYNDFDRVVICKTEVK